MADKKSKKKTKVTIREAVDNLSHLAELDVSEKKVEALLDPTQREANEEKITETFQTLNRYLQHCYAKEKSAFKDPKTQKGVKALMELAEEASHKIEKYTTLFKGEVEHSNSALAYQELQKFYLSKIVSKKEKQSKKPSSIEVEQPLSNREILKDLDTVHQDREYELFYIYTEEGLPFFNPALLRHVHLVGDADETIASEEDISILKQMDMTLDREYHSSAKEIFQGAETALENFYRHAAKFHTNPFVFSLHKAAMGLMLAANPYNLAAPGKLKSCVHYFTDFERYLREALACPEYEHLYESIKDKKEEGWKAALKLAHLFCNLLFFRLSDTQNVLKFIQELGGKEKTGSLWENLSFCDENIRNKLAEAPSGPLLKTLHAFEQGEEKSGFDPLLQFNAPEQLFTLASDTLNLSFLHLPTPTHQEYIDRVGVDPEFIGFLRSLGDKKHLLINLQDRTSWKEFHRAEKLEKLITYKDLSSHLTVVTLATETDFYHQQNEYAELNKWEDFHTHFKEQLLSGEQCGFYFPPSLTDRASLFDKLLHFVHAEFFDKASTLERKERIDFIEIFYFFLILLLLEKENPASASFTCKDGIDTGAGLACEFFGFAQFLSSSKKWTEKEKQFFLYTLYRPALLVRHRALQLKRFYRTLSALEHFEKVLGTKRDKVLKACAHLFPDFPFEKLHFTEVA